MMQPETWNAIGDYSSKVWAAVGPLVGVWIGAVLAKRWQREQWIADNKRAEYRKLLTTLTRSEPARMHPAGSRSACFEQG